MKKSIQIIGVVAVMLVTLFACKKNEPEVKKEEIFSVAIQVGTKAGSENAILIGTKEELKAALTQISRRVSLKRVSDKNNVFRPVVGAEPGDPADPNKPCWDEIDAIIAANMAEWQAIANANCMPFGICVPCPNAGIGVSPLVVIQPNSRKCNPLPTFELQYALISFPFGDGDLNGEAVAMHINPKR